MNDNCIFYLDTYLTPDLTLTCATADITDWLSENSITATVERPASHISGFIAFGQEREALLFHLTWVGTYGVRQGLDRRSIQWGVRDHARRAQRRLAP